MSGISVRELDFQEISEVSGGLSMSVGGAAITSIGVGALGGPVGLAAFAIGLGVTLMVGGTAMEEGMS
jgi:hypothetical protein